MGITNAELKQMLENLGAKQDRRDEKRAERDLAVASRLGAIENHLRVLNGSVADNIERLGSLPCVSHGEVLTRLATWMDMQPTPREMGRLEANQEAHKANWKRVWEFVKYPLLLLIAALVALVISKG